MQLQKDGQKAETPDLVQVLNAEQQAPRICNLLRRLKTHRHLKGFSKAPKQVKSFDNFTKHLFTYLET